MTNTVVVVGAGLAGLVATAELLAAGRHVTLLDAENGASLGGQAFWSFGGLFLVDSPEQRRLGVKDSAELALADWLGSAQFGRRRPRWGRAWAEGFVSFAAGEMRSWLAGQGVQVVPAGPVGRARRLRGRRARQLGPPVPRHVGHRPRDPRAVRPRPARRPPRGTRRRPLPAPRHRPGHHRRRRDRRARRRARVRRRRPRGAEQPDRRAPLRARRGLRRDRDRRHRRQPRPRARHVAVRGGHAARADALRGAGPRGRLGHRGGAQRRGSRRARGPHVALPRGHHQPLAGLEPARDPHPRGPEQPLARRRRQPPAGTPVPRLRLARRAPAHHVARRRPLLVRARQDDPGRGVRPVRLRAEPRPDRQGPAPAARTRQAGRRRDRSRPSRRSPTSSSGPTRRPSWRRR